MAQIVWQGNLLDFTGYAKAAREYVMALHSQGIDVKIEPMFLPLPQVELPHDQRSVLQHLMAKPKSKHHKVYIVHQIPDFWKRRLHPTIGFTYWETSKIQAQWVRKTQQMNAVFLPSRHNVEAFRQSGVTAPLFHIRPCLSPARSHAMPDQTPSFLRRLPPFRFLSVFSWIERKGYDVLLKAFWEEFSPRDNVALVIKTIGSPSILHEVEALKAKFQIFHATAPVYVDLEVRSDGAIDALYRNCQAFVLPSRGEGICYPLLEAAAQGMPIIATGWGGHTDFLHEQNSYPIPYHFVQVPPQSYYHGYESDQQWAEPSVARLRQIMRHVYEHYDQAATRGEAARQYVLHHFTHERAAQDIVSAVSQLTGWRFS